MGISETIFNHIILGNFLYIDLHAFLCAHVRLQKDTCTGKQSFFSLICALCEVFSDFHKLLTVFTSLWNFNDTGYVYVS